MQATTEPEQRKPDRGVKRKGTVEFTASAEDEEDAAADAVAGGQLGGSVVSAEKMRRMKGKGSGAGGSGGGGLSKRNGRGSAAINLDRFD